MTARSLTPLTPIVVLGASGMLGRAVTAQLAARAVRFAAPTRAELDLADGERTAALIPGDTRTIINCAAWTDVDAAEQCEAEATRINGHAVGALARRARELRAALVFFSTDYVFDGLGDSPYPVAAPLLPMNAYGRSKALGERLVRESGAEHLIIRTSWLYAPWGKNFVRTIARLARERTSLSVVADQRGCPTSAEPLAARSLELLAAGARGTYHLADGGECTWFELARAITEQLAPTCTVVPCTSADYPRPAPRPRYSVLDLSASVALLGPVTPWQVSLKRVLERLAETSE